MRRAPLVVSLGCPAGIGPEVSVAAVSKARVPCVIVGDLRTVKTAAAAVGVGGDRIRLVSTVSALSSIRAGEVAIWGQSAAPPRASRPGRPTLQDGAVQLRWIDQALALVSSGQGRALVTGPVSKDVIARSKAPRAASFRGHTEYLARRLRCPEVVMAFWSKRLCMSLVTTHLRISRVPGAITREAVCSASFWTTKLVASLGEASPRVAITSLNPHAGEGGLLGDEEESSISPGIALARKRLKREGIGGTLVGPIGAETAIRLGASGQYQAVVAMYHDQATIPMKLVGFGDAVNVSLGLSIVRTSVDHGTAYDVAGKGIASSRGMHEALKLADRMTRG